MVALSLDDANLSIENTCRARRAKLLSQTLGLNLPVTMRFKGKLKSWNEDRGFGFIDPIQGGQEIFVHITAFGPRSGRPQVNELPWFEIELGPQGKNILEATEGFSRPMRVLLSRSRSCPPFLYRNRHKKPAKQVRA